jgi:hypothetical protein
MGRGIRLLNKLYGLIPKKRVINVGIYYTVPGQHFKAC